MKTSFLLVPVFLFLFSTTASAGIMDGLVAHYEFEGDFTDSAGTNYGTASGGTSFSVGVIGQSASFDGLNDAVTVANTESVLGPNPSAWSVAFWGMDNSPTSGKKTFVADYHGGSGQDTHFGFHFASESTGQTTVAVRDTPDQSVAFGNTLQSGEWNHYAMTASESLSQVNYYIDGILTDTVSLAAGDHIDSFPMYFGAIFINGGLSEFLNGELDDVRIYNRALSSSEVGTLAQGVPTPATFLLFIIGLTAIRCRRAGT